MACCSRRTGSLLVGIADLITGSAALSAVCFLLYIVSSEIEKEQNDYSTQREERLHILSGLYWCAMLAYVFPALVTLITGTLAIFAVSHNNDCCAITSILLTVILVFACAGIALILYIIRIELLFLIPLMFGTVMHMCFTFILLSFRTNHLKAQQTI